MSESNPQFIVVRYEPGSGTYEIGRFVSGPGVDTLRRVLSELNSTVRLEIGESA